MGPPHERAPANPREGDLPEATFTGLAARLGGASTGNLWSGLFPHFKPLSSGSLGGCGYVMKTIPITGLFKDKRSGLQTHPERLSFLLRVEAADSLGQPLHAGSSEFPSEEPRLSRPCWENSKHKLNPDTICGFQRNENKCRKS